MGLDVYLYRYNNRKKIMDALEEQYQAASTKAWDFGERKYEQLTEADKDQARAAEKAVALKLGLDEHGNHPDKIKIEINSPQFPEHMFKIGYLRSSYNDGGLNRVLERAGIGNLYDIFEPPQDAYDFRPDWEESVERARDILEQWKVRQTTEEAKYEVFGLSPNPFKPDQQLPANDREALVLFMEQVAKDKGRDKTFRHFSNLSGHFSLDGLKVFALIHGTEPNFLGGGTRPATYVVFENDSQKDDWYGQALAITVEMCEWVLQQPVPDQFYLHWSG